MKILDIIIISFILLETSNVLALYFKPTLKQANAVGVFTEWGKSKEKESTFRLLKYLTYWVAGTKVIFISLLLAIVIFADDTTKMVSTGVLTISISLFYWKMFPLIKKMDKKNELITPGYSKTLAIMIGTIILALIFSLLSAIYRR